MAKTWTNRWIHYWLGIVSALPVVVILVTGLLVAAASAIGDAAETYDLTNIGTLFAFVIVCGAVLIMRRTNPAAERPFKAPWVPFVPVMGILLCLLLMFSLPPENWLRLFIWLALGFLIYFGYGRKHSVLAKLRMEKKG